MAAADWVMLATRTRILFIIDEYLGSRAGTERQLELLIKGLDSKRFAPELAVLRASHERSLEAFPCPVRVWNIHRLASVRTVWRMARIARGLRIEGFRLAHLFFNDTAILCPLFLKAAGLRVVTSRRDMGYWYTRSGLMALRANARMTDAWVVNARVVGAHVIDQEGAPRARVRLIENGYETAISADKSRTIPFRERLSGKFVVGIVANVRPIKRVPDLLEAVAVARSEGLDAVSLVVGGGNIGHLQNRADELGMRHSIHLTGQVSNPADYIELFDVGVLCSESEGLSNAIIEYMAMGKPVIATRAGGNAELIEEGVTGFLVEVGDTRALAARIVELAKDRSLAARLGDAGRKLVAERFAAQGMVEEHARLYQTLLKNPVDGR